jgi:hypothetical protein
MAKRLPLIILVWLATDVYFYQAVQTFINSSAYLWAYWLIDLLLMSGIVAAIFVRRGSRIRQTLIAWLMGLMLLAFVPRLFSLPFLLVEGKRTGVSHGRYAVPHCAVRDYTRAAFLSCKA